MTMKKKLLITIACLSVILCTLVAGTIAWLTDNTQPIVNEFTPSNIDVELSEGTFNGKMVPGKDIAKEVTVKVEYDISCYVFVKVEEALGAWAADGKTFASYFTYEVADGWIELQDGVYYRVLTSENEQKAVQTFNVLKNNKVTVNNTVTKGDMEKLDADGAKMPTLTFTAYVCQSEGMADAAAAWTAAQPATN